MDVLGMEREKIELKDLVSKKEIQKVIDSFAGATGLGACAHGVDGEPFTSPSNWCKFCAEYNRKSKIGYKRCVASDKKLGDETIRTGKPAINYCGNGRLLDAAAPIIIEGHYVGFVTCGQVLPKTPDLDEYRKIAREIGVDEEGYIEALKKVSIMSEERFRKNVNLLWDITTILSNLGYNNLKAKREREKQKKAIRSVSDVLGNAMKGGYDTRVNTEGWNEEIKLLGSAINSLLELIKFEIEEKK